MRSCVLTNLFTDDELYLDEASYSNNLVAQRYTQIPGVDFTEKYSPVFPDFTLRVVLIMWLIKKWDSQTIDA